MTKVRWWLDAVLWIASTASVMRCSAVSAPIVMSVPNMSLSIEPTRPTRDSCRWASARARSIAPSRDQLVEQLGPLGAELVGPAEAAVAADDHERVDVALDEVASRPPPAVAGPEVRAAGGAEDGPAQVQDPADVGRGHRADAVTAIDEALQALVDGEHLEPGGEAAADDRPHRRVHAGRVAAAGEDGELGGDRRHRRNSASSAGVLAVTMDDRRGLRNDDGAWTPRSTCSTRV